MENSVKTVKQAEGKNSCELSDMQRLGVETTYWGVDADGEPEGYQDHSDSDFYEVEYHCTNCLNDFDSWDDVKGHLDGES